MNTKTLRYTSSDKADFDYPKLKSGWEGSERNVAAQSMEYRVQTTEHRAYSMEYSEQSTEYEYVA